ncbi:hypothetical protein O181_118159, partial [Austropuccinia psidii MF-1]|nr:hypothetical protein [Austropuccinia psidii MF-1]
GPGEDGEEEKENSVEEEESDGTEGVPAPVGAYQGTGGPTLAQSNQPVSHQSEPSLLAIMQQMTQIMANLQAASSSEASRPPALRTASMKAPEIFDGTQPFKVRSFIHSCQLIFHNDPENLSQDRKKVLYATSFSLAGLQNGLSFIFPISPIKIQITFSIHGIYININSSPYLGSQMKSLVSGVGDWGESALIHHFRKGLPSRIFDQLASCPSRIDSLHDLMYITLELDTRYHERQNEKVHDQEKKPEASKSNYSHPPSSSSSSQKKKQNFQKRDKPHSSLLNKDFKLMNSKKERRMKEGLCTYCGGKHSLESCCKRPQNKLTHLSGKFPSQGKA